MITEKNILLDHIGYVNLIEHIGGDLSIVNDARVSYDKKSDSLTDKDKKLIDYLIKHKHYSPLRSTVFKFEVKSPLSTARQWYKHHISSSIKEEQDSWNEKSFRYSKLTQQEFYIPAHYRSQSTNNNQQSGSLLSINKAQTCNQIYTSSVNESFKAYKWLINTGLAREQARDVLPSCLYTTFIWTTSLQAALNFVDLRLADGAQWEIRQYAIAVNYIISQIAPITLKAWEKYNDDY